MGSIELECLNDKIVFKKFDCLSSCESLQSRSHFGLENNFSLSLNLSKVNAIARKTFGRMHRAKFLYPIKSK